MTISQIAILSYRLLSPHGRRRLTQLTVSNLLSSILEVVSIGSILPFMALAGNPQLVEQNPRLMAWVHFWGVQPGPNLVITIGLVTLALLAGGNLLTATNSHFMLAFSAREQTELSTRLLRLYLGKEYAWYSSQNPSRLTNNVMWVGPAVVTGVGLSMVRLLARCFAILLISVALLLINPMIAVASCLVFGCSYVLVYLALRGRLAGMGVQKHSADHRRMQLAREALDGFKITTILGKPDFFASRYHELVRLSSNISAWMASLSELPRFVLETVAMGSVVVLVIFLVGSGRDLQSVVPTLSVFVLGAYRLLPALQQSFTYVASIRGHEHSLMEIQRELTDLTGDRQTLSQEDLPFTREIRLENVHFHYAGMPNPVLDDVSLTIPRNTTVAFVGTTGAGKTTIIDVILGLLWPTQGRVLMDGQPLTPANVSSWHQRIGYVPQDVYLMDASVRQNIAFGCSPESIDDEAVQRAARVARIEAFILSELPQGYDTLVGDRGIRLSGGQRQRLGIARAMYHNPQVLVLDEATSALDSETEEAVMEAVSSLAAERTIFMIAHRLSTVRKADQIHVMRQGRIEASGTFQELMESNETFRGLAQSSLLPA